MTTLEVYRELVLVVIAETAQIHDPGHAGGFSRSAGVLGAHAVGFLEIARVTHGVDQVVDDLDAGQGIVERATVENIGGPHVDVASPGDQVESLGTTRQASDIVTGSQQLGYQPSSDIAGGADHRDLHDDLDGGRSEPAVARRSMRWSANRHTARYGAATSGTPKPTRQRCESIFSTT